MNLSRKTQWGPCSDCYYGAVWPRSSLCASLLALINMTATIRSRRLNRKTFSNALTGNIIMYTANITLSLLKHCKPWSDFSVWNSLIWAYNVCPYTYFYLSKADIVHRGTYIEPSDLYPHWLPPYLWCHCTFISQNEYRQLSRVYFSADAARDIFKINIQVNLRFKQTLWTLIRLLLWRCLFWVDTVCLYTFIYPKSATIRSRRLKQVTFSNVSFKG